MNASYIPKTLLEKAYLKYFDKNWNLKALLSNDNISLDVVKHIIDRVKPTYNPESDPKVASKSFL